MRSTRPNIREETRPAIRGFRAITVDWYWAGLRIGPTDSRILLQPLFPLAIPNFLWGLRHGQLECSSANRIGQSGDCFADVPQIGYTRPTSSRNIAPDCHRRAAQCGKIYSF